jgi:2-iminobutanoate/2-iminopropanoate deaminase
METETIATSHAPQAIGPYSQGKRAGDFVFTAAQVAIDPMTPGKLIAGGIREQTGQVLKNLAAILEAGGSSLPDAVRTTVFMVDLSEFAAMNEVYGQFFKQSPPARSTVQVAALPLGSRVAIDVIATFTAR